MANSGKRYGCWLTFFASLEGILYIVQLVSCELHSFHSFTVHPEINFVVASISTRKTFRVFYVVSEQF